MRDTLVAIDTGFTLIQCFLVVLRCAVLLHRKAHIVELLAVPAFTRVSFFHRGPNPCRQFKAMFVKLLRRVDHTGDKVAVKLS